MLSDVWGRGWGRDPDREPGGTCGPGRAGK